MSVGKAGGRDVTVAHGVGKPSLNSDFLGAEIRWEGGRVAAAAHQAACDLAWPFHSAPLQVLRHTLSPPAACSAVAGGGAGRACPLPSPLYCRFRCKPAAAWAQWLTPLLLPS